MAIGIVGKIRNNKKSDKITLYENLWAETLFRCWAFMDTISNGYISRVASKKAQPFSIKKQFFRVYNRFFTVYNKQCTRKQNVDWK